MRGETQNALLMSEFIQLNFDENGDPGEAFEAAEELARKMKNRFDMDINESILSHSPYQQNSIGIWNC